MNKLKIAIYTICRDEEKNVDKFLTSCQGADHVIIGIDVRTTDGTRSKLEAWGVTIVDIDVVPWDFSKARNITLDLVPQDVDVCVCIDLDEVLSPKWRDIIEELWEPDLDILQYNYIYQWMDEECSIPGLTLPGFKVHARHSYVWNGMIHENLKYLKEGNDNKKYTDRITVYHYPDLKKNRNYIEIIDMAIENEPTNDWLIYIRARDNFTSKRYEDCIVDCKKYLNMTIAYKTVELGECRSECLRMNARCLHFLSQERNERVGDVGEIQLHMMRAVAESPNDRINWVYLAEAWQLFGDELAALSAFRNALSLTDRSRSPECEERCWDDGYLINQIKNLKLKLNLKNKHI